MMSRTEPLTTTTMKTDRHHLRRILAVLVALVALAAALAISLAAGGTPRPRRVSRPGPPRGT